MKFTDYQKATKISYCHLDSDMLNSYQGLTLLQFMEKKSITNDAVEFVVGESGRAVLIDSSNYHVAISVEDGMTREELITTAIIKGDIFVKP